MNENFGKEYLEKNRAKCPPMRENCQMNDQKDFSANNSINKRISTLFDKCPIETYTPESGSVDMAEHLQQGSNKSFKCPFYELGCIHEKIEYERLTDHFQEETINHCKIMIDMIIQLKNEVLELKQNELLIRSELSVFKENKRKESKDKNILETFNLKIEQKVENLLESSENNVENSYGAISMEKESDVENYNLDNSLVMIRLSNKSVSSQQGISEDQISIQMEERFDDMKQVRLSGSLFCLNEIKKWNRKMDQLVNKKIIENTEDIMKKLNDLDHRFNMKDNIFEWRINKINQITKNENIISEFFFNRLNPYKMRLKLRISTNFLWIRLRVYSGLSDASRKWPFHADVTVKISNVLSPDACQIITQNCKINKPIVSSYRSSDRFTFLFTDLSCFGLLNDCDCIVECFVDFE